MIRLYSTSAFYFALAYPGSNLLSIGQLFAVTLVHQGFHGGEEAAASASLPLAKRSVLGGLLPESLLYVLKRSGPAAFAAAMVSDSDTPEIIWTHKMRAENLIRQVLQHLGDFPQKLSQYAMFCMTMPQCLQLHTLNLEMKCGVIIITRGICVMKSAFQIGLLLSSLQDP
ncbi:hypothetical protein HN51_044226 [Arachis hypogaea]|nr:uncharacterized protein DS421_18g618410 [Arachis hypogaea]